MLVKLFSRARGILRSFLGACLLLVVGMGLAQGADGPPPLSPEAALAALSTPEDLVADLVLAEPIVQQPVCMNWDDRGRLWVCNYVQYPFPAGLKILSEDRFLRATYDKVPLPPPDHFPGLDRVSIHEDTDGDGTYDSHKVFLEGMNIVTSALPGRGGVWVLNPPYLLFYPDRNRDDVPDGDPEVHLAGFGLEDTHSCASCLQWGPDGWLYAAQGSTVSGHVIRPGLDKEPVHSLGQLIWRYHPETRRYEIFAEGGGNAWGVEIDAAGRVYSGHNGGDTRGFHYVQGGYYQKGFSKHGELSNPYAFGYFPPMKHPSVPRFTHTFILYDGGALPERYFGKLFGVAPLLNYVVVSDVQSDGTSFRTEDIFNALSTTTDPWFRPVDVKVGPDGAVYVADMYEAQIAHLRHHEGLVDTSNGRIYRLRAKESQPLAPFNLAQLSTVELLEYLRHPNKWFRRQALVLLGDRRDASVVPQLVEQLEHAEGQLALETLWAINLCGGFDEQLALTALEHPTPGVREWAIRLLGDTRQISSPAADVLARHAEQENDMHVRSQIASTARRLSAEQTARLVRALATHAEDAADIHIPLLLWWALESHADHGRDALLAMLDDPSFWQLPLTQEQLLGRLMRRYAATGQRRDLLTCAELLRRAPDAAASQRLMAGFEEAYAGRSLANLPDELIAAMAASGGVSDVLAVRQRSPEATERALAVLVDSSADAQQRLQFVQVFGEIREPRCVSALLALVEETDNEPLRVAALGALRSYDQPEIPQRLIELYGTLSPESLAVAQSVLSSRKAWAVLFVQAVAAGVIAADTVPEDVVRGLTIHNDEGLQQLVASTWGQVEGGTTEEMQALIAQLAGTIQAGQGSPYSGKQIYLNLCGKCHLLFGQGGQIGPDLTSYKRDDIANLLLHVVNPSAEIREGFETFTMLTSDGRALTGFVVERDSQVVVVRGADGQNVIVPTDEIDELEPSRRSLMPEGVLKPLDEQQIRDLFAYLRSSQPLAD